MPANQKTIENRLAEFTEVHGTVLLGMHRELQSQNKQIDEKLQGALNYVNDLEKVIRKEHFALMSNMSNRFKLFDSQLDKFTVDYTQREESLQSLIDKHVIQFQDADRRLEEKTNRIASNLADQIKKTSVNLANMLKETEDKFNLHLHAAMANFQQSQDDFSRGIAVSESKITSYMIKQQQLFDEQSNKVQSLHAETQQLLVETNNKIELHQQREMKFNRKTRQFTYGLALFILLAAVIGVSRLWTS